MPPASPNGIAQLPCDRRIEVSTPVSPEPSVTPAAPAGAVPAPYRPLTAEEVVTRFGGMIRGVSRMLAIGPAISAEDLEQVGMMAAISAAERFDPIHGKSLENWVRTIAHFAMVDEARNEMRHACHVDLDDVGDPADALKDLRATHGGASNLDLAGAIDRLPERYRAVIMGVYFEGHKYHEIGEKLGITRQRVHQIHQAALEKLRIEMAV